MWGSPEEIVCRNLQGVLWNSTAEIPSETHGSTFEENLGGICEVVLEDIPCIVKDIKKRVLGVTHLENMLDEIVIKKILEVPTKLVLLLKKSLKGINRKKNTDGNIERIPKGIPVEFIGGNSVIILDYIFKIEFLKYLLEEAQNPQMAY